MSWLSEAVHHSDAATISAVAACAAALVASVVATIQFSIGRRQAQAALISAQAASMSAQAALINAKNVGRYKLAEFHQAWIYKVIDAICEHCSLAMARMDEEDTSPAENTAFFASRVRLEILLNPEEPDSIALIGSLETTYAPGSEGQRLNPMLTVARRLLKREWVRIKDELSHLPAE